MTSVAGELANAGYSGSVLVCRLDQIDELDALLARENPESVLFVGWWRGLVYVGPYWRVGRAGCPRCLVTRCANSAFGPDQAGQAVVRGGPPLPGALAGLGPAAAACARILALGQLSAPAEDATRIFVHDVAAGTVEPQRLLPDSTCPTCGDTASAGTLPVFADGELTKVEPAVLRASPLDHDDLEGRLLAKGAGLFKEVWQDLQNPFAACSVRLPSTFGPREPALGRAANFRDARGIALVEGLERYAGLRRGGRPATVRGAYRELTGDALDPRLLGTHPGSCYAQPGFRYREFDPDVVVDWVAAYSFRTGQPVLVPERAAYWGPRFDDEVSFCYDTSNGCAVGGSVEEAVLHGLREVAERDSFLLSWYRRLALPEVPLHEAADARLRELVAKCELVTGFRYRAFLSTMEYGLPSFVLAACGSGGPDGPAVIAGSGAHPDPVQAITGGLHELAGMVLSVQHSYAERRAEALAMLADPALVRRMEDHATVNCVPEARSRFDFLLDAPAGEIALADVPATVRLDTLDLRADLATTLEGFLAAGLDVLVVEQTMPELAGAGLRCVKVIVPGLVPMTFGHQYRRTANLPRLLTGDGLPYRSQLDTSTAETAVAQPVEIGALPHPFP